MHQESSNMVPFNVPRPPIVLSKKIIEFERTAVLAYVLNNGVHNLVEKLDGTLLLVPSDSKCVLHLKSDIPFLNRVSVRFESSFLMIFQK